MFRPGAIHQQIIQHGLHLGQFAGHALPQHLVVSQRLGFDARDDLLALVDQFVELLVAADVELAEPVKELREVLDGRVAKHLGPPVGLAGQPFDQMGHQLLQLLDKRLLGQLHRFVETSGHAFAFGLVQVRLELPQVVGNLQRREIPRHVEQRHCVLRSMRKPLRLKISSWR